MNGVLPGNDNAESKARELLGKINSFEEEIREQLAAIKGILKGFSVMTKILEEMETEFRENIGEANTAEINRFAEELMQTRDLQRRAVAKVSNLLSILVKIEAQKMTATKFILVNDQIFLN